VRGANLGTARELGGAGPSSRCGARTRPAARWVALRGPLADAEARDALLGRLAARGEPGVRYLHQLERAFAAGVREAGRQRRFEERVREYARAALDEGER
jgi:hypothetical protein